MKAAGWMASPGNSAAPLMKAMLIGLRVDPPVLAERLEGWSRMVKDMCLPGFEFPGCWFPAMVTFLECLFFLFCGAQAEFWGAQPMLLPRNSL